MTLSVNVSNAEPGDGITIATIADPDSIVLLSMSDSSLHLLRESCKSATQDNVSITQTTTSITQTLLLV